MSFVEASGISWNPLVTVINFNRVLLNAKLFDIAKVLVFIRTLYWNVKTKLNNLFKVNNLFAVKFFSISSGVCVYIPAVLNS